MTPTKKAMAPYSSTLAWKIPWAEEPGRLQSLGALRVGPDWATSLSLSCLGEGNGNPLQCSCLENPRDDGAWWAAVYGVAQSRTRLKRLSSSSSFRVELIEEELSAVCYCSVTKSCPILCNSSKESYDSWLDMTWTAAHQASLSFAVSQSLLKLMSVGLVMPSNHLIPVAPFSSCPQSFPASGSFPVSWLFASGG